MTVAKEEAEDVIEGVTDTGAVWTVELGGIHIILRAWPRTAGASIASAQAMMSPEESVDVYL